MNVATYLQQVARRFYIDRFVPATKQTTVCLPQVIVVLRVNSVYVPHRSRQVSPRGAQQQMIVIAHQTVPMHLQCETLVCLLKTP